MSTSSCTGVRVVAEAAHREGLRSESERVQRAADPTFAGVLEAAAAPPRTDQSCDGATKSLQADACAVDESRRGLFEVSYFSQVAGSEEGESSRGKPEVAHLRQQGGLQSHGEGGSKDTERASDVQGKVRVPSAQEAGQFGPGNESARHSDSSTTRECASHVLYRDICCSKYSPLCFLTRHVSPSW